MVEHVGGSRMCGDGGIVMSGNGCRFFLITLSKINIISFSPSGFI